MSVFTIILPTTPQLRSAMQMIAVIKQFFLHLFEHNATAFASPLARLRLEELDNRITPSGSLSTLASFNGTDGYAPYAGVVMDASANLYGATSLGGSTYTPTSNGDGAIFELAHDSATITTLASFDGPDGSIPVGLTMGSNGNLYGTTAIGGGFNDGVVFELTRDSGTITVLASFNGTNGANPQCAPVLDSNGNLFGTTSSGGASGNGVIFEVLEGSLAITPLASFDTTTGTQTVATLLLDKSGDLFGTAQSGGVFGGGTIFELAKGSNTITTIVSFDGTNGSNPVAPLILDKAGNIYGTTNSGGSYENGTVFELPAGATSIATLASFNGTDGANPTGLVMDSLGDLFGTTYSGGEFDNGTVFELASGSTTITPLASFGTNYILADTTTPPVMDSNGNLYGATAGGGANNGGTVFEFTLDRSLSDIIVTSE